jgi:hypothetical protein
MGAFPQLRADERSALPCVRWAWTTTKGSIATTGCSEKRQLVEPKGKPCALLGLLVEMFVADGDPLVVGIDETLERRWGMKIAAKGVYRDPVRSTHEEFVKSSVL